MSLKNRLIFSFSMMVTLSVFLGALLIASSWILRSRYIAYSRSRQSFDLLSDLSQTFEKERRALDGYLIGLNSEREKFNAAEVELRRLFNRWEALDLFFSEKEEKKKLEARFKSFDAALSQVFRLVETERRAEAIQVMESAALPMLDGLQKELRNLTAEKKLQSDRSWKSAERLAGRTTLFSVLLLISVLFAGAGFSILLYQSISRPLEKLREGTKKIAQGKWNLKLELTEPVELAELARSFEEMAKSLADLQAQVVQMDRMSAIGTLAGGVAHEINNPLTGVLGQAQLLLEKMFPGDPHRAHVEKIERAAQRCRKIVRGLLDFSRPQEYAFQAEDADHLIGATMSLCESEMEVLGIEIFWEKNPGLPKIWASANQLQQVFLNILTNSMHAMPNGGALTIQTQSVSSPYSFPSKGEGDFVEVSFKDTGVGIAAEHLSHLFDPFFTTKEPGKGTGLGLSISYGIVQQHQGEIEAKSDGMNRGATFKVRIPVATTFLESDTEKGEKKLQETEQRIARLE